MGGQQHGLPLSGPCPHPLGGWNVSYTPWSLPCCALPGHLALLPRAGHSMEVQRLPPFAPAALLSGGEVFSITPKGASEFSDGFAKGLDNGAGPDGRDLPESAPASKLHH